MSNKTILKILLNDIKQIFVILTILLFFACCAAYGFFSLSGIIFVSMTFVFGSAVFTGDWLEIIFISNTVFLTIGGISYWIIYIIKRAKENEREKN